MLVFDQSVMKFYHDILCKVGDKNTKSAMHWPENGNHAQLGQ